MVCETKIVADEHDALPAAGTKREPMMWSSAPAAAGAGPSPAELHAAVKDVRGRDAVLIREFERADEQEALRIFHEGIMERIPNTAFRGIWQRPRTQCLYALLTGENT